jgi:hypothetical protein
MGRMQLLGMEESLYPLSAIPANPRGSPSHYFLLCL